MMVTGGRLSVPPESLVAGRAVGRPPALTSQQQDEGRQRRAEGTTLKDLALSYNVGVATIARLSQAAP